MRRPIRILGIDPGLRRTGWGVVAIDGNRLTFLACGSVATDNKAGLAVRLLAIHDGLQRVVAEHAPDEAAVEQGRRIIHFRNCQGCHILDGTGGDIRTTMQDTGFAPPPLNFEGKKAQSD